MLLWLRKQVVESRQTPWLERLAMKLFLAGMKDSRIYSFGSWALRLVLKLSGNSLKIPGWTETRDFPSPAEKSFKTLWKEMERRKET
jgi:L-lactate utilization protein LutB